ncbi:zinc finger HIT domain-containing protein 3 isoform X2 [Eurosta solidaginis]|uniref:zinc finger HIT domain-containing protein 3 isoform X2 n=1 Tax=Eurosta solidaginis TaxID=178769 RepID=UPI0035313919
MYNLRQSILRFFFNSCKKNALRGVCCSLVCYQEHQKIACESTVPLAAELPDVHNHEPTLHQPFSTEDTVPRIKMELLKNSKELHNLLYNKHMRHLLTEIDVAPDAWKAMKAAMQEPLFLEFANECLKIVEPQTSDELN